MKKLISPISILFTVTLPEILLFAIYGRIFYIIHTELEKNQIGCWAMFGIALMIICVSFTIYALFELMRKQTIKIHMALLMFGFYVAFVIVYFFKYSTLLPGNISGYMLMGISPLNVLLTLVMPALFHSAMLITLYIIERFQLTSVKKPFLLMIVIPVFWYIFINIGSFISYGGVSPLYTPVLEWITFFIFLVSSVVFLFLALIVISMLITRYKDKWTKYMTVIVLLASLGGLALNASLHNLLGDFSHLGFWIADIIVIGVLLVPKVSNKWWRLVLFGLKVCGIWYSIYFFIVFLPYLPFVLPGTIILGLGLLLLAPALLILIHVKDIRSDYKFLIGYFKKQNIWILMALALSVVPLGTAIFLHSEKVNIENALRYVYQRSYKEKEEITVNTEGIKRVLKNGYMLSAGRGNTEDLFFNGNIPYLSSLYQNVVMDGLTLAPKKINALESIYFGVYDERAETVLLQEGNNIILKEVTADTLFDEDEKVFKSWIHLELENTSFGGAEFYTVFKLPQGSYISDYYLYVEGEKKHGMLVDKRAANWLYHENKTINRDPGVLTNLGDNEIEFKIFPFAKGEIRQTGIEIIHNRPIKLDIAGTAISLQANNMKNIAQSQEDLEIHPQIHYITQEAKASLTKITRTPKYYFIMDLSEGNEENKEKYIDRINTYIEKQGIEKDIKEIIGVNYKEKRLEYQGKWEERIKSLETEGGFYPEYTIYQILYENYINPSEYRPIFILVTDEMEKAVFTKNMAELSFACPEGISYYHLGEGGQLKEYTEPIIPYTNQGRNVSNISDIPVLVWKNKDGKIFYIPDDKEDTLILTESDIVLDKVGSTTWESGVLLEALYRSYLLEPHKQTQKTHEVVKLSISTKVMSPLTSFIVLENEAQEKVMLEKQKQILESTKPIDIEDMTARDLANRNTTEMEEPSVYIIAFMILCYIWIRKKKAIRSRV